MKKALLFVAFLTTIFYGFSHQLYQLTFTEHLEEKKVTSFSPSSNTAYAMVPISENFENAQNWNFTTGTSPNKWAIGTAAFTGTGSTKALYISNDDGATNAYNNNNSATVHAYKTYPIAAGTTEVSVDFDWRCKAESGTWDFMRVWIVADSFTPTSGTTITALANQRIKIGGDFNNEANWKHFSGIVNLAPFAGQSVKLVIEWKNDAFSGDNPPAAIDNIKISPVLCNGPQAATASAITINSATLTWGAPTATNVDQYEYYYATTNAITPTTTPSGTSSTPSQNLTSLAGSSTYYFWVRTKCTGTDGNSVWVGPTTFSTLPPNDSCNQATVVPVNPGTECVQSVPGTLAGATVETPALPGCTNTAPVKDVWFEFTATSTKHIIGLSGLTTSSNVYIGLYANDICSNASAPILCQQNVNLIANNLVPGVTYKIRVYTTSATNNSSFQLCIVTPLPPISTNIEQYTVEQLVTDVLIQNECANISNISFRTGTNYGSVNGIGYFSGNGSNFPFQEGIILSSGDAMKAPGPKSGTQAAGTTAWVGDADLTAILQAQNITAGIVNASVIEFDFFAISNSISFNFLFASDEYGTFQCSYSDAFAFILTDLATNTSTNLAVIPNTTIPISAVTIRNNLYNTSCASANPEYFDKYYSGNAGDIASITAPINFRGSTVPMVASSPVVPGNQYHIKLVLADGNNSTTYDSAVFLEAGSFDIGSINLGDDLLVGTHNALCDSESHDIDTGLDPTVFTFKWMKDGQLIQGAEGPSYTATESGDYTVIATVNQSECSLTSSIRIEFYPPINIGNPKDIQLCALKNQIPEVDLRQNESVILAPMAGNANQQFSFSYYTSQTDAENQANAIPNPGNYVAPQLPQVIFVRIKNTETNCYKIASFSLKLTPIDYFQGLRNIQTCKYPNEISPVDISVVEQDMANRLQAGVSLTYHHTEQDALDLVNSIQNKTNYTPASLPETIFVSIVDTANGCQSISSFQIQESETIPVYSVPDIVSCNGYVLVPLPANYYYSTEALGQGEILQAGKVYGKGVYEVYINAKNELGCVFSSMQKIEVIDCFVAKGISPNNDGLNDTFDLSNYHPISVKIYNRYGKEVYSHGVGYTNQWAGQDKSGKLLPDGTYFYRIVTTTEDITGYIQLVREIK